MKYGLLADIHANRDCLSQVLAIFAESGVERIFCLGDIVDIIHSARYPERSLECLDLLGNADAEIVKGNHEDWFLGVKAKRQPQVGKIKQLQQRIARFANRIEFEFGYFVHQIQAGDNCDETHLARTDIPASIAQFYPKREKIIRKIFPKPHHRIVGVGHVHTPRYYCSDGSHEILKAGGMIMLDPSKKYVLDPGTIDAMSLRKLDRRPTYGILHLGSVERFEVMGL